MAANLMAMASNLEVMTSTLEVMASNLRKSDGLHPNQENQGEPAVLGPFGHLRP